MSAVTTAGGPRLLIVGNPHPIHLGAHLLQAAETLGVPAAIADVTAAFAGPRLLRALGWRLGRRPPRIAAFSRSVVERCRELRPSAVLATGLAPISREDLEQIGRLGVTRINYLTDDPWNPAHRAPWFLRALPAYDLVCSPRRANLAELGQAGCRRVEYLPFGYSPAVHFAERLTVAERERLRCDLLFAGGADADRVPVATALIKAGFDVALYGGYWDRYPATRPYDRGHADMATLRRAVAGAAVTLCLVRRANRDGHVMRTFEVPAMGGCMLAEDTAEHRVILGEDGETVRYFRDEAGMVAVLRELLARPAERERLARTAHSRITTGGHSYTDRLAAALRAAGVAVAHEPAVAR